MVMELLVADQPERATSHDPTSHFWSQADFVAVTREPLSGRRALGSRTSSHPAMRVNLDCLHPVQPVRARLP